MPTTTRLFKTAWESIIESSSKGGRSCHPRGIARRRSQRGEMGRTIFLAGLILLFSFLSQISSAVTHEESESVMLQLRARLKSQAEGLGANLKLKFTAFNVWQDSHWDTYVVQNDQSTSRTDWSTPFNVSVWKSMPLEIEGELEVTCNDVAEYQIYISVPDEKYVSYVKRIDVPGAGRIAKKMIEVKGMTDHLVTHTYRIMLKRSEPGAPAGKVGTVMAQSQNLKLSLGYGKSGQSLGSLTLWNVWSGSGYVAVPDVSGEVFVVNYANGTRSQIISPQMTIDYHAASDPNGIWTTYFDYFDNETQLGTDAAETTPGGTVYYRDYTGLTPIIRYA
jgi:type II secretory pathway pseudopilin PulG